MHVSARSDYAVRAMIVLAMNESGPCTAGFIATEQEIPPTFLNNVLADLRRSGLVGSQRGSAGGYFLTRPPSEIAIAHIMRAVEGQLADVQGVRPESLEYNDSAASLQRVWVAARQAMRSVLDDTTLAQVVSQQLPEPVNEWCEQDNAWQ